MIRRLVRGRIAGGSPSTNSWPTGAEVWNTRRIKLLAALVALSISTVSAQRSTTYEIPWQVQPVGGGEDAKSNDYILDDSIGEPVVGDAGSTNYSLDAGYRQPEEVVTSLGLGCTDMAVIGTIVTSGQATGSGACVVTTDNPGGYALTWSVTTGSGGTNTGYLVSEREDAIPPLFASRSGLVGHWRMDETTAGATVIDASGNGNHGAPQGAGGANNLPQPSSDVPAGTNVADARSLGFDASDDHVALGDKASLEGMPQLTIAAWVRKPSEAGFKPIISKWNSGGDYSYWFGLSDNRFHVQIRSTTGGEDTQRAASTITANTWTHLVAAYSADGGRTKLYVNGEVVTSFGLQLGIGQTAAVSANTAPIEMARYAGGNYLGGHLNDVRIYNRGLSAAEVKALYNEPQPWTVGASESAWASRLSSRSTDTDAKWGTDGSGEKWLNVGDGTYPVVTRTSATPVDGSTEILQFRAEIGALKSQPVGTYRANVTLTASAL